MKTGRLKKLFAVVLATALSVSVLAGCGSSSSSSTKSASGSAQELNFNIGSDLKTLDPALNQAVDGGIVLENLFEGLYKPDDNMKPVPGIAESYDLSDDQLTYTFHLRKDAKWSNGDPVTAGDFEYAWKRVLNPDTAAEYAYQMMYLEGAEEYNGGTGSADAVGVKATDDYTLEVKLTAPCSYFLDLTSFPCYFPVDQKVAESNKDWATKAETYVSNGPFKLTDYKIKDGMVLEKSDSYYNKDAVTLDKLNIKFVSDSTSAWANYKAGQFDMVYEVPKAEVPAGQKDGSVTIIPLLGTYYYSINVTDKAAQIDPNAAKVLGDKNVREALNLGIDREAIVNALNCGKTAATSFVPIGLPGADGKDFKDTDYFPAKGDLTKAKKLLSDAGYPDGKGFPQIVLLYNPEKDEHATIAQAIQQMWKTNLGIDVQLQSQEWKVFQQTRNDKNFEIARDAWVGDYNDPMTFLDMLQTKSGQNNSGYSNPEYDKIVDEAKVETDANKREELLHQAEAMLMEDYPVLPIYYDSQPVGVQSYVKGLKTSPLGFIYFDKVTIEK